MKEFLFKAGASMMRIGARTILQFRNNAKARVREVIEDMKGSTIKSGLYGATVGTTLVYSTFEYGSKMVDKLWMLRSKGPTQVLKTGYQEATGKKAEAQVQEVIASCSSLEVQIKELQQNVDKRFNELQIQLWNLTLADKLSQALISQNESLRRENLLLKRRCDLLESRLRYRSFQHESRSFPRGFAGTGPGVTGGRADTVQEQARVEATAPAQ